MDYIYLDHNSTTPTRPEVVEAMARCYAAGYANPASQHQPGQRARRILEDARQRVAEILGADLNCLKPDRLIFTSGGTEANNLAILGIAQAGCRRCGQVIVSSIEHACVLEAAEHLMELGWRLDTLPVDRQGVVQADALKPLLATTLRSSPEEGEAEAGRLVSAMLANHETGVLQPIEHLAGICSSAGVPLHTDAVAAAGKVPISFRGLGVTALSIAAHKFQGPLGIGALIVRHETTLVPMLFGGHQQEGLRPSTESVVLAVGMQTALELWQKEQVEHCRKLTALRDRFESGLKAGRPDVIVHSEGVARLPQTCNIAFPGLEGQILLLALDMAGVACSVGSACASGSTELSPTLRAMGLPNDIVASSLRFSLGATTTEAQIDEAIVRILRVCQELGV
ncbi:MAG: cysteine desulfurase family protein [Thermoguttaceae bacterium]